MHRLTLLALASLCLVAWGFSLAADPPEKESEIKLEAARCPVTGGGVKKEFSTKYKQGTIFFADAAALAKYNGKRDHYSAQANLQLFATKQYEQSHCPLTGRKLSGKFVTIEGVKVYVCCQNCVTMSAKAKQEDQLKFFFGNQSFDRQFRAAKKQ